MNGPLKGRTWEATEVLRVGRLETLEVVLDDNSVSRFHAEVKATDRGWRVRDLGSTNGTRLNGVRLGNGPWPVRARDLLQFGEIAVVVEAICDGEPAPEPDIGTLPESMRVAATSHLSWSEAMEGLAFDGHRCPRPGDQLLALVRAGHHLVHIEKEDELLGSVLDDAVSVLDAQRGAIVLWEDDRLNLKKSRVGRSLPRASINGLGEISTRMPYSQCLASRCISRGESILCQRVDEDPELALARSIEEGAMASVICVLLRTPRKTLGVLHLDRSPWQPRFTQEDLRLADALAANVSAGIECAQLLRKQRDLFLNTITVMAQVIELRDEYTANHTDRVTAYSLLLAENLRLSVEDVELLRLGTPLHDIGKIGIADAILNKPDRLTAEEFEIMKTHTVKGDAILAIIPDLAQVRPIARSHHERWDGRGYPDGKAGQDIHHLARVVALADSFDAMTSDRAYRKAMSPEAAFAEIERQAGKQFDPTYAATFLAIKASLLEEMKKSAQQGPTRKTRVAAN
jgi:HD-GYP domain-containing protein (c-di-GMP phosphodiesterase class II)/pSer/pThr/pTyr-binding forkhead associated (FHA) protein